MTPAIELSETGDEAYATFGVIRGQSPCDWRLCQLLARMTAPSVAWFVEGSETFRNRFSGPMGRRWERKQLGKGFEGSGCTPKPKADFVLNLTAAFPGTAGEWFFADSDDGTVGLYPAVLKAFMNGRSSVSLALCRWTEGNGAQRLYDGRLRLRRTLARTLDAVPAALPDWVAIAARKMAQGHVGEEIFPRRADADSHSFLSLLVRQAANLGRLARELATLEEWNIGVAELDSPSDILTAQVAQKARWLPRARRLCFRADPFAWREGERLRIAYEELDYRVGKGLLGSVCLPAEGEALEHALLAEFPVHASYPYSFEWDGKRWIVPERSEAGECRAYMLEENGSLSATSQLLLAQPLVDASIVRHSGRYWLFGGLASDDPNGKLFIWHAPTPLGPWSPHALNPVKCDPGSARCGGTPFELDGRLYRPAQDCSQTYGGAVVLLRVDELGPTAFRETPVHRLEPAAASPYPDGLHTLCIVGRTVVIDGKRSRLNWRAPWLRYLGDRRSARRSARKTAPRCGGEHP